MGQILQRDFSEGWNPSADQVNGPDSALYRMDNLVLDERGAISLRLGSSKVNSSALATTDVRSLHSATISGTRYRLAQGAGSIYAAAGSGAFASIASGFDVGLDTQFSSYLGQIVIASGTVKKKYDGTTVRNWGLAAPSAVPTVAVASASNKVFASCDSGEITWTDNESSGAATNVNGFDGTANGARSLLANATTLRGVMSRDIGASTDFTDYGSGVLATDDDIIEMYVRIDDPTKVDSIMLTVDFNGASAASFDQDYAVFTWQIRQPEIIQTDIETQLASDYTVEGFDRRDVIDRTEDRPGFAYTIRSEANGWHYLSAKRGSFQYVKTNDARWWNTVRGVRVSFSGAGQATVAFDRIRIYGGSTKGLDGKYVYRSVNVRVDTSYTASGAPSGASAEIILKNEGATVTATNPTDTQATHIWLFRMGGKLDGFYRVATLAVTTYSGTVAISDTMNDKDALILNIRMETDNAVPPDNIIGISEDYFTRIFCLSSDGNLYPSRKLNPDSFSAAQVIKVHGASEVGYWIKKAYGGLYVGTSKDIYRIDGTGAENPDGTIDFTLRSLNINSPPISSALAWDGNILIYMANDGPRLFTGETSSPLRGSTDLLWRGYARHGVSAINVASGRFKMAIAKGLLEMIVPEGQDSTTSAVLYKYSLGQERWYRHSHTGQSWRALFRENDGTLLAGDNAGFVWVLEDSAASGDAGTGIPITIWTRHYTLATGKGDPTLLQARMDTGGTTATVTVHIDGAGTTLTWSPAMSGESTKQVALSTVARFRQIGLRIGGTFTTFRLYDFGLYWNDLPDFRTFWEIGSVDLGTEIVWLREVRLKAFPIANLTVTPYFDGVSKTAKTVIPDGSDTSVYPVPMGRECRGKQLSGLTISSASEFPLYWVEFIYRNSGGETQKKTVKVAA